MEPLMTADFINGALFGVCLSGFFVVYLAAKRIIQFTKRVK